MLIFAALAVIGCSDNPAVRNRYQAEKLLFEAERALSDAQIKPELAGADQARLLQDRYAAVVSFGYTSLPAVKRSGDSLTRAELEQIIFRATNRLTQMLYAAGKFDSCLVLLRKLEDQLALDQSARMLLAYNVGRAYQASGQWDSAQAIYGRATNHFQPPLFPDSTIAFQIFNLPLHQFEVSVAIGDTAGARRFAYDAEQYYLETERNYPKTKLIAAARANLARLYDQSGRYLEAIEMLSLMTDSAGAIPLTARLRVADITAANLRQFDLALLRYDSIAASIVGPDTLARPLLLYKKAVILLNQRKFADCRSALVQLENQYAGWYRSYPPAQQAKARSFHAEGNWERAESEYRYLIENYPASAEAMQALLGLAAEYATRGLQRESESWYERAERHFQEQAVRASGTPTEARPLMFLAELFRQRENWNGAVTALDQIFKRFPRTEEGRQAAVISATIFREKLNDPAQADERLQALRRSLTNVDDRSEK